MPHCLDGIGELGLERLERRGLTCGVRHSRGLALRRKNLMLAGRVRATHVSR